VPERAGDRSGARFSKEGLWVGEGHRDLLHSQHVGKRFILGCVFDNFACRSEVSNSDPEEVCGLVVTNDLALVVDHWLGGDVNRLAIGLGDSMVVKHLVQDLGFERSCPHRFAGRRRRSLHPQRDED